MSRIGVPDGMRKRDALPLWGKAREEAKRFIKIMEDAGKVDAVVVPGSEQEMAKKALEEAYVNAVSPMTDMKNKASFVRIVLEWTKAKPESKNKLTLENSEAWLNALQEDLKKDADGQ